MRSAVRLRETQPGDQRTKNRATADNSDVQPQRRTSQRQPDPKNPDRLGSFPSFSTPRAAYRFGRRVFYGLAREVFPVGSLFGISSINTSVSTGGILSMNASYKRPASCGLLA